MPDPGRGGKLTQFSRQVIDMIAGVFPWSGKPQNDVNAGIMSTVYQDQNGQPTTTSLSPSGIPQQMSESAIQASNLNTPPPGLPLPGPPAFYGTQNKVRVDPWFGPGRGMRPVAPKEDVAGRAWDYNPTFNIGLTPRQGATTSFKSLRGMADYDLVRAAIETRKDQFSKLQWSILPKTNAPDELRGTPDARCIEVENFLQLPDRRNTWHNWQRMLIEDRLVIDAASIYVRRDLGGKPYSLDVVDGTLIKVLIDVTGRQPEPPLAAYQQIIKGMPAVDYTSDELIYAVGNPRPGHAYGMGVVEQILITINVAILRDVARLAMFQEGNIPEAILSVPESWTPEQISRFQSYWDTVLADPLVRRRVKFVPANMQYQPTRSDESLVDQFDEWIARVIAYAFSLPPTPFVRMTNRATAETAYETSLEEGLQPLMLWFKSIMDRIVQRVFGYADLEFVWDAIDKVDPAEQQVRDLSMIQIGLKSIDEVRAGMGLAPIGMSHAIFGGANGPIFIDDLVRAHAQGLTAMQAPQPMGGQSVPGDPGYIDGQASPVQPQASLPAPNGLPPTAPENMPAHSFNSQAVLAGIPIKLLQAVGLGPEGPAGRKINVTTSEASRSDPLARLVPHPQVLATLRDAERRLGKRA